MSAAFRSITVAVLALSLSACGQEPAPRPAPPAVPKIDISAKLQLGREALAANHYGDAVAIFSETVKLRPDDAVARELLNQALDGKRKDDFAKLLKSGTAALEAENYETAFADLSAADKLMPDDQVVQHLLKRAEFPWRQIQGRAAMETKRFQDAVTAFTAALKLRPDDGPCQKLLDEARAARRAQIMMEFAAALAEGKARMAEKNYNAAIKSFTLALTLVPGNPEAQTLQVEARRQQNTIEGLQAKTAGKTALGQNRLDEALSQFGKAKALLPGDVEVVSLWGVANDRKNAELAAKKKKDFDGHMSRADIALAGNRYDDAINAYRQAEGLFPGGMALSRRMSAELRQKLAYDRHITSANFAMSGKRYDEAIRECDAAERVMRSGTQHIFIRNQARAKKHGPPV